MVEKRCDRFFTETSGPSDSKHSDPFFAISQAKFESNGVAPVAYSVRLTSDESRKDMEMNQDSGIEERARATKNDPRWISIVNRDASDDGNFYYSVKSTGVYCRPSCAARLARPENVQYHLTCEDAEKAGFRPCKR